MPANSDSRQCVLTAPVVDSTDGQVAVVDVGDQRLPAAQAIGDCLCSGRAMRDLTSLVKEPFAQRLSDGIMEPETWRAWRR